jgi:hypothetical protein
MSAPERALATLAEELRADPVLAEHVADSGAAPTLGVLVGAGPRAAADPSAYAVIVEAVREAYLLHYGGAPRLLAGADPDLRLLAGDYLYAVGLERLAARGDLEAVRELADLISLLAQAHAERLVPDAAPALWIAATVAVGAGAGAAHIEAKAAMRGGDPDAPRLLLEAAATSADGIGMREALAAAADSIGFAPQDSPARG